MFIRLLLFLLSLYLGNLDQPTDFSPYKLKIYILIYNTSNLAAYKIVWLFYH